jgi:hypothetical protein
MVTQPGNMNKLVTITSNNKTRNVTALQSAISIPMGMNCPPPFADLFLHTYEADFLQGLLKNKDRQLANTEVVTKQLSIR